MTKMNEPGDPEAIEAADALAHATQLTVVAKAALAGKEASLEDYAEAADVLIKAAGILIVRAMPGRERTAKLAMANVLRRHATRLKAGK